jgi:predicted permease
MRNALVVTQVALSLVLLAGAGLFLRTLRNAQATDVTRAPEQVLMMNLNLAQRRHPEERGRQFYADLMDRVRALQGVENAAYVMVVPMGGRRGGMNIAPHPGEKPRQVDFNVVSPTYFDTIGLPVVRGRAFTPRDREGAPHVAMVNEEAVRRFWPDEDPIGKQVRLERPPRMMEIVGVVHDGRFRNYRAEINPCFYVPLGQFPSLWMNLEVRVVGNPTRIAPLLLREIRTLDKDFPTPEIRTLRAYRDGGLGQERLSAALLGGLGLLGLILAAVGLYGVLAFSVAQRTKEIGVRMALGADAAQVLRSVLREALLLIGAGLAAGLAAVFALARLVASLLYGVSPGDPWTHLSAAGALIVIGLAAAGVPARRAARVDPVVALRHE